MTGKDIENILRNFYTSSPYMFIIVFIVIILFFFQIEMFIYLIALALFITSILYMYFTYWKRPKKHHKKKNSSGTSSSNTNEVFHVSNKIFTYNDAKDVCKSYGGRLANYEDMVDAYRKGANWCTLGWSDDQQTWFPAQQDTIDLLKKYPESENSCGTAGVNGGYVKDASTLFGANCYGKKPEPTQDEKAFMGFMSTYFKSDTAINPETTLEVSQNSQGDGSYWDKHKSELLIASHNLNTWNSK